MTVVGVLAIVVVWVNRQLTGANEQPTPSPTAIITVAAPTPTPQPTPASFTYGVTVRDPEGQPIPHAQVIMEIEGKAPLEDEADSSGFAWLEVPTSYMERAGRLRVYADGFTPFDQNIDIY